MRNKKVTKQEENKKEALEQNSDSGYEESAAKTSKRRPRAKTVSSVELKKTESKSTAQKQKPGRNPRNVKKDVKEEGPAMPVRARQGRSREAATPTRATKVKSEGANTEPRRRSARLTQPR